MLSIPKKYADYFNTGILFTIIFSSILIGFESFPALHAQYSHFFSTADMLVLLIFSIEIIFRIAAYGRHWYRFFTSGWNLFDFFLVAISILPYFATSGAIDTHAVISLRLVRLARVFRVLRVARLVEKFGNLKILVETLIKSMPSMLNVILLLSILFYIYAIIGVGIFGKTDPIHFGSLDLALLTLIQCVTDKWSELMETLMYGGMYTFHDKTVPIQPYDLPFIVPIYFISFYFLAGLIILNLFVGVLVSELTNMQEQEKKNRIKSKLEDDLAESALSAVMEIHEQLEALQGKFLRLQERLDIVKKNN